MIYLDHNATTPLSSASIAWMKEAESSWGNPSSSHAVGRKSLELLDKCRETLAKCFGCTSEEVVFTSGGSEANTNILLGWMLGSPSPFKCLVSPVEHASVRDASELIQRQGEVRHIRLMSNGDLDLHDLEKQLSEFRPSLVSVMAANNETGIVFPIPRVAELCRRFGALLHCDAVQALGKVESAHWASADFVSFSAHKVNGPKGIGAMVMRTTGSLVATHFGGSQERKRRGGTQNMIGIAGFGGALSTPIRLEEVHKMQLMRDRFEKNLVERFGNIQIQGANTTRLANTSNIRIPEISSELILQSLDLEGICISAGSACSSGSLKPSPVLLAMGMSTDIAKECFRVSLGRDTTDEEMSQFFERLCGHVDRIRHRRSFM